MAASGRQHAMTAGWRWASRPPDAGERALMGQLGPRWRQLVARCRDPRHREWPRAGGRGLVIADDWVGAGPAGAGSIGTPDGLLAFCRSVGPPPAPDWWIVQGGPGWLPSTCRWESPDRGRSRPLVWRGRTVRSRLELADLTGLPVSRIYGRLRTGQTAEQASRPGRLPCGTAPRDGGPTGRSAWERADLPVGRRLRAVSATTRLACDGTVRTVAEWSAQSGVSVPALRARLVAGWGIVAALVRAGERPPGNRPLGRPPGRPGGLARSGG